jgi:outer membrane protein assembly factor BamB
VRPCFGSLVTCMAFALGCSAHDPRRVVVAPTFDEPAPPVDRWSARIDGWGRPVIADGMVYAMTRQHEVVAIDERTGRVRWRSRTGVTDGVPFGSVLGFAAPHVIAGDYDVIAFDGQTGALRWRFSPAQGYGPGLYLGDVARGTAFAGSPAGYLYGVSADDGALRWSASMNTATAATVYQPRVHEDLVIAGFTVFETPPRGGLVAVETARGIEKWHTYFPRGASAARSTGWAGGPVVWDGTLVAASATGSIYGFSPATGEIVFEIPPEDDTSMTQDFRALAVVDDILVAGSSSGDVSAYERHTYHGRWRYRAPQLGSVAFALTVDERFVYVPFVGGRLVAIDARTGQPRWRSDRRQGLFAWPPAVMDGHVYAAGAGSITAFAP